MEKTSSIFEMLDDRRCQRLELRVTIAEILLIVVRSLLGDSPAFRTIAIAHQISSLTRPAANRTLDPIVDPRGQFVEWHIQRDNRIKSEIVITEPILKEQCLR